MGRQQIIVNIAGMGCGVANALQFGQFCQGKQQFSQPPNRSIRALSVIGIDVLTQKGDFQNALIEGFFNFLKNINHRAGIFRAACVGDDTKGTEFIASLLNGDKGAGPTMGHIGHGGIEFGDLRKIGDQGRTFLAHDFCDQLWQVMIGLGANDHIHKGGSTRHFLALGLGHASGHGNQSIRPLFAASVADGFDTPQFGIDFFCGLFPNVACVQQHQIGLLHVIRFLEMQWLQQGRHALAVIDIHLTAIGFQKQFTGWGFRHDGDAGFWVHGP